jgi:L-lactate dehydrogenase
MRIGIWGAGEIGTGLAYRLATTPFTSELFWINRSYDRIAQRVVDIEHGLAFAPSCWRVSAYPQERVARALSQAELLILTLGAPVPPGGSRKDVYTDNARVFRQAVVPALQTGFGGILLVVTNPVDLMARLIHLEAELPAPRVLGLGTVVETARLRASLGSYLSPQRPAREVWAYALGSHDERFVPVASPGLTMGDAIPEEEQNGILKWARREVAKGAARVKRDDRSTLHPVVEGTVAVAEALASDRRSILTVSTLDPTSAERLFYSVPCTVGREGILARHPDLLDEAEVWSGIERCQAGLLQTLRASEDS